MSNSAQNSFFRNCDKPTLIPVLGTIKGKIPPWLNGTLYRNGPGIQKVGPDTYKHMFDGLAVVHRFHIENGNVTYNSRPLESDTYHKNMAAERIVVGGFGSVGIGDPCDTLFSKFKSLFVTTDKKKNDVTDNCNVNVAFYGDQLYTMTETNNVRQIDPVTLKTVGEKTDLTDYLAINFASAHPHVLPDGTVLNLGINHRHKKGCCYLVIQVPPSFGSKETSFKDAKIIGEIPSRWRFYPGYYHSFGMTNDKIVFIEQPFCFNIPRFLVMNRFTSPNFASLHKWYPKEKTRIHVLSMINGEIHPVTYETDNLFVFHHANAYEEDGHLIVDVSAYDNAEYVTNDMNNDTINTKPYKNPGASTRRYVLPLDVSKAKPGENIVQLKNTTATATLRKGSKEIVDLKPQILYDAWLEFPRINYKFNGVKYRYIYGTTSSTPQELVAIPEPNILMKLNTENGATLTWVGSENHAWASEPVFVPNPTLENAAEDDGVIVSNLLHADDQLKTTLLILDAKTMKEVAAVEFLTEGNVTTAFHGQWSTTGDKVHLY